MGSGTAASMAVGAWRPPRRIHVLVPRTTRIFFVSSVFSQLCS
uniref:Uncharacterized protein n=1 Tax=Arundo donax TaxID=35708 RepID=A0A0A9H8K0_ARUDO